MYIMASGTLRAEKGGMETHVDTNKKERNEQQRWSGVGAEARQECERSRLWEFASAYLGKTGTCEITGGASTSDSVK